MIKVGDLVKRNTAIAIEDIHPLDMDFSQEYEVLAILKRHIRTRIDDVSFQVALLSIGEINTNLIERISK